MNRDKTVHDQDDAPLLQAVGGAFAYQTVGVAVSGGGDSLALLHLMARVAKDKGARLEAVTVDHQLRPEAQHEAEFVAEVCSHLKVRHQTVPWLHEKVVGNLQDQARRARYRLIAEWAKERGVDYVVVGHTADDQAETLLMELSRGAGLDGLAGMRPDWTQYGVRWGRPLLAHSRNELRDYLTRQGLRWIDDPSNEDNRYARVKTRKALELLEPLGITRSDLAVVAQNLLRARQALDHSVAEFARQVSYEVAGEVVVDRNALAQAQPEIARRFLLVALKWVSGAEYTPRASAQACLAQALADGHNITLSGCFVRVKEKKIFISREHKAVRDLTSSTEEIWDTRWRLEGPSSKELQLRALGLEGLKYCENWRETGASREALIASPAVWGGGRLVAAPLAGMANGYTVMLECPYSAAFSCH